MLEVEPYPISEDEDLSGEFYRTEVWISENALRKLQKHIEKCRREGALLHQTIVKYAKDGFKNWQNERGALRSEGKDVWRIGTRNHLFRLIGFFGEDRSEFIITGAGKKPGQSRGKLIDTLVAEAADIRDGKKWKKKHVN